MNDSVSNVQLGQRMHREYNAQRVALAQYRVSQGSRRIFGPITALIGIGSIVMLAITLSM